MRRIRSYPVLTPVTSAAASTPAFSNCPTQPEKSIKKVAERGGESGHPTLAAVLSDVDEDAQIDKYAYRQE